MAERRYRKFDPNRPQRPTRTSSQAVALEWLRTRPDQRVIRIQMEALGLAKRLKVELIGFAKEGAERSRFLRDLERLRARHPKMAALFLADTREKVLAASVVKLHLEELGSGPQGIAIQNRFSFAATTIVGRAKATKVEGLAAMLMLCASRAAAIRDPRPTEAAAMSVAVGLDLPVESAAAQARLEDAWAKRLRLVQARVERALAAGEKLLAEVGIPD